MKNILYVSSSSISCVLAKTYAFKASQKHNYSNNDNTGLSAKNKRTRDMLLVKNYAKPFF